MKKENEVPDKTSERLLAIEKRLFELENPQKFNILDKVKWMYSEEYSNYDYNYKSEGEEEKVTISVTIVDVSVEIRKKTYYNGLPYTVFNREYSVVLNESNEVYGLRKLQKEVVDEIYLM